MADDKLKTGPEPPGPDRPGDAPVKEAPPIQEPPVQETDAPGKTQEPAAPGTGPALQAEQSVIPGMGEDNPARSALWEVVVDFDKINELMSQRQAAAHGAVPKKLDRNDQAALKYVLTHEYVHIRRFDAITKLLFAAVLCIHWFNPLAWVMYVLANRDVELSCDAWVIRMMGAKNRSSYALMLIKMEERRNDMSALYSHFGKNAISERIEAIMKFKKTSTIACALALVLVVGATTAFANSDVNHENADTAQFVEYSRNLGNGTEHSVDNGETWISEEKYNELYPQLDIVYWTYEEYKEYLEEQIPVWQSLIGVKYKNVKGEWVEWTQETVDQCIAQAEEELEAIKNGALVSRTINGVNDPNFGITINNLNSDVDVTYTTTIIDQKGQEINLGSFSTEEERLTAVQDYCDEQIRLGNMTKEYAENLINDLQ